MDCQGASRWGWPRLLDQRLVMPEADPFHPGQIRGHPSQTRVQYQPSYVGIVLPEIDALDKDIVVVCIFAVFVHLLVKHSLFAALANGAVNCSPPGLQFVRRKEVMKDDETVFLIEVDLFLGQICVHAALTFGSGLVPTKLNDGP